MEYNLIIIKKKVKNITIKIKDSKTVIFTIPKYLNEVTFKEILSNKKLWIEKNLNKFKLREQLISTTHNSGDNFKFLGVSYPLKTQLGSSNKVTLENNIFLLTLSEEENDNIIFKEKIFNNWYQEQSKLVFQPIINHFLSLLNETIAMIKYSFMKTRWGSCNYLKKSIHLNLELLKAPVPLIEYVVLHELCHLKFPNHQKDFWNYVEFYMPDWKLRRKQLKSLVL